MLHATAAVPNTTALFSLPREGKMFSRLKAPVYALFKLMENMDNMEQSRMTDTSVTESVSALAEMKGLSSPKCAAL